MAERTHISVAICGHVDSGKSTTTGHLLYKLGNINERELKKLKDEADARNKSSFFFAYVTDTSKAERERGITINCTTKEFFTPKYHYTIVDAPGHKEYIKNMLSGSSTCDTAILMVPADGGFIAAVKKGNRKAKEVEGQTRQHALLLNLLGIKQLIVCVNKMDEATAGYSQARFEEIRNEMRDMLIRIGWPKAFVETCCPIIPISGFKGDNLLEKSTNMEWWTGCDVKNAKGEMIHVNTLHDALNEYVCVPKRNVDAPLRIPVGGVYTTIKGVSEIICGKIEQGTVKPNDQVVFIPSNDTMACGGKVFSIEMHHRQVTSAGPGDNIGMVVKGINKDYRPSVGDVMILAKDKTIASAKTFVAQVKVLEHPGELKVGYTPVATVRTAKAPVRIVAINWKQGKSTSNQKVENPASIVSGDMAEVVFAPQQPLIVEEFAKCEGLGRVGILEGNSAVMLGRVVKVDF